MMCLFMFVDSELDFLPRTCTELYSFILNLFYFLFYFVCQKQKRNKISFRRLVKRKE